MLGLIQTKIQHGVASAAGNVTIEEVSDINKCIVITGTSGNAYLSDETTLVLGVATSWYVIELGGAVVE